MGFDYLHVPTFIAAIKEDKPYSTFLRDRYFPFDTAFATDEVLVEYKEGNKKLAPFVAPRVGGVSVKRQGYTANTFAPAYIAPKRPLTIDDLKKKRMGEAIYPQMSPEDRESELILEDTEELDGMISRREEWMAAQLLVNASCVMEEQTDNPDVVIEKEIIFYDGEANDWIYTPPVLWDNPDVKLKADIAAMCRAQKGRGVQATELICDAAAGSAILQNKEIKELLDNRNYNAGIVDPKEFEEYGVVELANLNFDGHLVKILQQVDTYEDEKGKIQPYIPYGTVTLLAPKCGCTRYGAITQLEDKEWHTYAERRVPLILTDTVKQSKEYRLAAAPLLMPIKKHAWMTAKVLNK